MQYEYKKERCCVFSSIHNNFLNKLGQEGWELVHIENTDGPTERLHQHIFKRARPCIELKYSGPTAEQLKWPKSDIFKDEPLTWQELNGFRGMDSRIVIDQTFEVNLDAGIQNEQTNNPKWHGLFNDSFDITEFKTADGILYHVQHNLYAYKNSSNLYTLAECIAVAEIHRITYKPKRAEYVVGGKARFNGQALNIDRIVIGATSKNLLLIEQNGNHPIEYNAALVVPYVAGE